MHDSIAQTKTETRHLRRCAVLVGVALACALFTAGQARAELLLKDSFGFAPVTSDGGTRLDANGNVVHVFLHSDLNGLRAEFPNNASAVWRVAGGRGVPTWGFSVTSPDPFEQYGTPSEPTPNDNGTMSLVVTPDDPQPPGKTDALLPFTPPAGPFRASMDVVGGGTTTALGFTSNTTTLYDNFQTSGQAWLVLHGGGGQGQLGTWELHTNGLAGLSASGTTLINGYNPISISYDPLTQTVQGSVNGVPTPVLPYAATGISGVGFEGVWTVNNFVVQTGVVPEPASLALLSIGATGLLLRHHRRS